MPVGRSPAWEGWVCWPGAPAVLLLEVSDTSLDIKKPALRNGEGKGRGLANTSLCVSGVIT